MVFKIGAPGILDSGFECHDQDALRPQLLCELIAGEGFAEAHLGVPQEARNGVRILLPARLEIGVGLLDCRRLFFAGREGFVMGASKGVACAQLSQHGADIRNGAVHPFKLRVGKALGGERGADSMIGDNSAIIARCAFVEFDGVIGDGSGLELLCHARLHIARRLADFELPLMRRIGNRIGIDARIGLRFRAEDILNSRLV